MVFSVVVPVYNVELYLKECVDSILSQTFTDFELILVDDGSKDESPAICDTYAEADSRVKVIHKENGGQSSARNLGVAHATGTYVIFLDSDDFIGDRNFFQDIHDTVEEDTDIVLYRYCKYYNDHMDFCGISLANLHAESKIELLRSLVARDAFFCSCWSKCTKLKLLKENGIVFDTNLCCEDMDWYYRVVTQAEKFKILDEAYINYRQRKNSVTATFKEKSITDYILTVRKWKAFFESMENQDEKEVMLASLAKLYCNLLIAYSSHRKELKQYKKEIFSFGNVLSYDLNPRTRKIHLFAKVFGLNGTCAILDILRKAR